MRRHLNVLILLGGCTLDPKLIGESVTEGSEESTVGPETGESTESSSSNSAGVTETDGCIGDCPSEERCTIVPYTIHGIEWNPEGELPVLVATGAGALRIVTGDPLDFENARLFDANSNEEYSADFVIDPQGDAATLVPDYNDGYVVQDRGPDLFSVTAASEIVGPAGEFFDAWDIAFAHDGRVLVAGLHTSTPQLEGEIFVNVHQGDDIVVDVLGIGEGWQPSGIGIAGSVGAHTYVEIRSSDTTVARHELVDIDDESNRYEVPGSFYAFVPDGDGWLAVDIADERDRLTRLDATFEPGPVLVDEDFEMNARPIVADDVLYLLEQQRYGLVLHGYDRSGTPLHTIPIDLALPMGVNGIGVGDTLFADGSIYVTGAVTFLGSESQGYVCRVPVGATTTG